MKEKSIVLEFDLPHPPKKVWRALTEPELLSRWLLKANFAPIVGQAIQFQREAMPGWDGVITGEVVGCREFQSLSYSWRALGVDTVITWTLEPTQTGTRLRFEQAGFDAEHKQAWGGALAGWRQMAGVALLALLEELE
jgi:uncharacterized protein YndB with AHSA1/START domain